MGKGVFIPEAILALAGLTLLQKAILALVIAYGQSGCFQSNRKLAEFFGCSVTTVKAAIKVLKNDGYVRDIETSKLKRRLKPNRSKCAPFMQDEIGRKAPQDRAESDPQWGRKRPINRAESDPQIKEERKTKQKLNKTFDQNSDEFRLAALLFERIQSRKDDLKKPNLQAWAKHIDLMMRKDKPKRTAERIERVIRWCQNDSGNGGNWRGWQNNILSTEKLREKFDKLELQMNNGARENGTKQIQQGRSFDNLESSIGETIAV